MAEGTVHGFILVWSGGPRADRGESILIGWEFTGEPRPGYRDRATELIVWFTPWPTGASSEGAAMKKPANNAPPMSAPAMYVRSAAPRRAWRPVAQSESST